MRIQVATGAMADAREGVRRAATRLGELEWSTGWRTDSGDVSADDAVRALSGAVTESLEQLERVLHTVSVVVDVAAADYARAEALAAHVSAGGR